MHFVIQASDSEGLNIETKTAKQLFDPEVRPCGTGRCNRHPAICPAAKQDLSNVCRPDDLPIPAAKIIVDLHRLSLDVRRHVHSTSHCAQVVMYGRKNLK
jgi:hypothetical protein